MITIKRTFPEISSFDNSEKTCMTLSCSSIIRKTFKSSQTQNPWNNKSSQQIREENYENLKNKIEQWKNTPEECSKCIKSKIPDVEINLITDSDIEDIKLLGEEIYNAQKFLKDTSNYIREKLQNKCIELKDSRYGKVSYVSIDSSSPDNIKLSLSYDIIRKDKKGLTEQSNHKYMDIRYND
jgi:hypothetical protein